MKFFFLSMTFIFLVSCSNTPVRIPAGAESGSCLELMSQLMPRKRVAFESPEAFEVREALGITRQELDDLLASKYFQKNIFDKEGGELHERSALILSMIKKNRPDFDERRVLMRYRRLFNSCGD